MTSLNNFRNCKMRTAQILWLRLCLFSLMIPRSSSTTWPELCENFLSIWLILEKDCFLLAFSCWGSSKERASSIGVDVNWILFHLLREQNVVDFRQVDAHVHQFKGSSARYLPIFFFTLSLFFSVVKTPDMFIWHFAWLASSNTCKDLRCTQLMRHYC